MNIIVLNGSPRPSGNTASFVKAFAEGASEAGHKVDAFNVARMRITGCMACESCHKEKSRCCVIRDEMQEIYPVLDSADMIVLASPIYYHSFSGQLQCAINRIYALDKPERLKKAAMILSSGDNSVYTGAIYEYERSFLEYLKLQNLGIFTYSEEQEKARLGKKIEEIRAFGRALEEESDEEDCNSSGNCSSNADCMPECGSRR